MDVDKFAKYFQAPAVYLEGRQHPVKIYHAVKSQEDYAFSALVTAFQIHRDNPASKRDLYLPSSFLLPRISAITLLRPPIVSNPARL